MLLKNLIFWLCSCTQGVSSLNEGVFLVSMRGSFSLWWFLLLRSTGSRAYGLQYCESWAVALGPSRCRIQTELPLGV